NNGIYGMTGGQMAPTTIEGMKTSTSPYGRDLQLMGNPLKITELVAQLPGTYFVARHSVHNPAAVRKTKRAVQKAFQIQKERKGLAFIEIVSNCNSGWKLPPVKANQWMVENMFPFFPPGDIKVDGELVKKE
ncbi:MAG: thiamine pyrophosphate-dependent enzyme, partial [Bacteroidales bacterium]